MIIRGDEPIFIIRRAQTGTDDYGNPTYERTETLIRHCLIAFGASGEPIDVNRDPIDTSITLYLPAGTVIEDGDIFEVRGTEWVKDGDAQEWPALWPGFVPDVVVQVRRRRG